MKLLFVGTNPEATGAAMHFVSLAQAMALAGHQVAAIVHRDGVIDRGLVDSAVHTLPGRFRNALDLRGYLVVFRAARGLQADWLVGNFGKEYWPLLVVGRLLGIPVALFRHRTPPMKRLSAYWIPRLAQRFFAVSEHARQAYLDRGIAPARVRVMYNPVDTRRFCPAPEQGGRVRMELGIPLDAIVLGYAGRMHGRKGVFELLQAAQLAMREEPRLHCIWLGDGPAATDLRQRIDEDTQTARRHHWVGWQDALHSYYCAMSMLGFPSIMTETFGRVSIEAQATGVPVLGSDIGGIAETLQPGLSGLLLPPGNIEAWRGAILWLCDEARRARMSFQARCFVDEHFSYATIAKLFDQSLQEPERAPALVQAVSDAADVPRATSRISRTRKTRR